MKSALIAAALAVSVPTSAVALDSDPTSGQLSQTTCNAIIEAIGTLTLRRIEMDLCGLPQCLIVAFDIRMAILELEQMWLDGRCHIYQYPLRPRFYAPTYSGTVRG